VEILVNQGTVGTAALYGYDGTTNYYQLNLGILPQGTYEVQAKFPRTRK